MVSGPSPNSGERSDASTEAADIGQVFREGSGRAVAALIRTFGDIEVAEDAVQDAFAIALATWPTKGVPPNPAAWIITTGRNRGIDRLRRESLGRALLGEAVRDQVPEAEEGEPHATHDDPLSDHRLRLIFTCCHPALSQEAQIALTLRLLCGLATNEVARAFLVEESTMAQRLVRAKRKIKAAQIPYRVPSSRELPLRLSPVLATVYLVYNSGADHPPGTDAKIADLCDEGIRLARLLHALMPNEPEVIGLLALLLFNESRRKARFAKDGTLVLLRDQVRALWAWEQINEARKLLRVCLVRDEAGPYQIQAAIQAVHAEAATALQTDWPQVVRLYDELLHMLRTPVVAMNRAIAVGEVEGPAVALELVDALDLGSYYLFHAVRADLLRRLGQEEDARAAYEDALSKAPTEAERIFLRASMIEGSD